jgi:hypothetical protein
MIEAVLGVRRLRPDFGEVIIDLDGLHDVAIRRGIPEAALCGRDTLGI